MVIFPNRIYHWYVDYKSEKQSNHTLGEIRPFFVIGEKGDVVAFIPIVGLEHLGSKPLYIKKMALKIFNYRQANLSKPCYIDVGHGIVLMPVDDFYKIVEEKNNVGLGRLTDLQLKQLMTLIAKLE